MEAIKYADKTGHWENWWHGYYYGAFYIFPPEEIMSTVDELRKKYDPKSASFCRAHISLSEPLTKAITDDDIESLSKELSSVESFEMNYGPLRTHPPYPGVTFTITPEDKFSLLRKIIHSNKLFAGVELKRSTIVPHMTIAEFITNEQTTQIYDELKDQVESGKFLCQEIVLAVPDNNMYFNRVLTIPLKKK